MTTLWLFLKRHISTQNEGKDSLATCTSIFQNFLRGWWHAGGSIGGVPSKGLGRLGILSSAEVANLLGDVGACSPGKF